MNRMSSDGVQKNSRPDFSHEVKCMMYSFGDVREPHPESVALVEGIVHSQMAEIVVKAADVACLRGGKSLLIGDILFLLRKNVDKLRDVLRHLKLKDLVKTANKSADLEDPNDAESIRPPATKKRKNSLCFLNEHDQSIVDSQGQNSSLTHRLQRMDEITKDMNATEYMDFTHCRQVTFRKSTVKFNEWLNLDSLTDLKLSQDVIELLGYLSYETVREIVELSLCVKEDMKHTSLTPHINTSHYPLTHFGTTPTFFTTPADTCSSPTSPTSQTTMTLRGHEKRQQSASLSTPLDQASVTSSGYLDRAIQPNHIQEAMRRFNYMLGPLVPLSAHFSKSTLYGRTLCT